MTNENAAQPKDNSPRSRTSIAATARSEFRRSLRRCSYQSEAKNPAYAPAVRADRRAAAEAPRPDPCRGAIPRPLADTLAPDGSPPVGEAAVTLLPERALMGHHGPITSFVSRRVGPRLRADGARGGGGGHAVGLRSARRIPRTRSGSVATPTSRTARSGSISSIPPSRGQAGRSAMSASRCRRARRCRRSRSPAVSMSRTARAT